MASSSMPSAPSPSGCPQGLELFGLHVQHSSAESETGPWDTMGLHQVTAAVINSSLTKLRKPRLVPDSPTVQPLQAHSLQAKAN